MYSVGEKVYCIKDMSYDGKLYYKKGNYYTIEKVLHYATKYYLITTINDARPGFSEHNEHNYAFSKYFRSVFEMRRMKLKFLDYV